MPAMSASLGWLFPLKCWAAALVDPVSNQWPNVGTIQAKLLGCVRFRTKGIIFEVYQGSDWAASARTAGIGRPTGRANARR
jgi:hypothetical protein